MKDKNNTHLSPHTYEFLIELKNAIRHWHEQPLLADHGVDASLARLYGIAGDIIRLTDPTGGRGWDIEKIAYEINVGFNEDREDNGDVLLATPMDELEGQLDVAPCKNREADDVATPVYDGIQYLGKSSPSISKAKMTEAAERLEGQGHA